MSVSGRPDESVFGVLAFATRYWPAAFETWEEWRGALSETRLAALGVRVAFREWGWGRGGRGDAAPGLSGRVGLVYVQGAGAVRARAPTETNRPLTDGDSIVSAPGGEGGKKVV